MIKKGEKRGVTVNDNNQIGQPRTSKGMTQNTKNRKRRIFSKKRKNEDETSSNKGETGMRLSSGSSNISETKQEVPAKDDANCPFCGETFKKSK